MTLMFFATWTSSIPSPYMSEKEEKTTMQIQFTSLFHPRSASADMMFPRWDRTDTSSNLRDIQMDMTYINTVWHILHIGPFEVFCLQYCFYVVYWNSWGDGISTHFNSWYFNTFWHVFPLLDTKKTNWILNTIWHFWSMK